METDDGCDNGVTVINYQLATITDKKHFLESFRYSEAFALGFQNEEIFSLFYTYSDSMFKPSNTQ